MARTERERIGDILTAIADIRVDTAGMDFDSFSRNPLVVRSVLYSIGLIGEAAKHIGTEMKAAIPDVPWRAITGMRDRVVHEYFRTDTRRIRDVVTEDIGPLERASRDALKPGGGPASS